MDKGFGNFTRDFECIQIDDPESRHAGRNCLPDLDIDLVDCTVDGRLDPRHLELFLKTGDSLFKRFFICLGLQELDLGSDLLVPKVFLAIENLGGQVQLCLGFGNSLADHAIVDRGE